MQTPKVKLNLGSGVRLLPGFINVDNFFTLEELKDGVKTKKGFFRNAVVPRGAEFVKADIRKLPFPDNYADYVYLSHVIEHLSFGQVTVALKEVYRVMKPGGEFVLLTNDFDGLVTEWISVMTEKFDLQTYSDRMQEFYGNQMSGGEFHLSGFNANFLNYCLVEAGFKDGEVGKIRKFQSFPKFDGLIVAKDAVARNAQLFAKVKK